VHTSAGFAFNHGGIWPDMQTIWAGYAGPGIASRGVDTTTWTDQVDTRPTQARAQIAQANQLLTAAHALSQ
jgi:hypothetical protein